MGDGGGILDALLASIERLKPVFVQERTFERARRLGLGLLMVTGVHHISRAITAVGRDRDFDWSADYRLFSRARWKVADVFKHVVAACLSHLGRDRYIVAALDETHIKRNGKRIPQASWLRDPLSPPFHVNFIWGIRLLQASLIVTVRSGRRVIQRGIPVACELLPKLSKPKKNASEEEVETYLEMKRNSPPLTTVARSVAEDLRARLDSLGADGKTLLIAADGSFANKRILRDPIDRVEWVVRCRKDAKLCLPAEPGSQRVYAEKKFTPEQVRKDTSLGWTEIRISQRGVRLTLEVRETNNVLWEGGARRRPLRLIVIRGDRFQVSPRRRGKREPAYLLTTDLKASLERLVQAYMDRWEIEVNHRDEKQHIGVGEAQVWSQESVPRNPGFAVATYSLLLLASLEAFGPERTDAYPRLPSWRKGRPWRPSCRDMLMQLRREVLDSPGKLKALGFEVTLESINKAAA